MTGDFSGEPFFSINASSMKVKSYGETIKFNFGMDNGSNFLGGENGTVL